MDNYQIEELLQANAFAKVFRIKSKQDGKLYVLKQIDMEHMLEF